MTVWRMHIACWIPKATNTHTHTHTLRICNIYCLFTSTVVARTRLCVTFIRTVHCLSRWECSRKFFTSLCLKLILFCQCVLVIWLFFSTSLQLLPVLWCGYRYPAVPSVVVPHLLRTTSASPALVNNSFFICHLAHGTCTIKWVLCVNARTVRLQKHLAQ